MRSKVNLFRYALTISTVLCSLVATPQAWSQLTEERMLEAFEREQAKFEKIDAALEKKITLESKQQPLTKLAEELSTQMGVDVELDVAGLELAGVTEDDQITAKLQNVSARSGLKRILAQLDLTYIIKDEALIITSEGCGYDLVERIYDVSHLIQKSVATGSNTVRLGNSRRLRAEELAEHLQDTVAPEAWENYGGTSAISVYIFGESRVFLVVSTQSDIHDSVTILLGRLTAILDRTSPNNSESVSQANNTTNSAKLAEAKKPELIEEDQIVTFVYPIKQHLMKSGEAVELIETVLGKEVLQMEKGSFLIKKIGNTVVIKHYKKVQDQIYKLLEDADVLQEEGEPLRPTYRGCYSVIPVVG